MKQRPDPQWETRLQQTARAFAYPPTPDIAAGVQRQLQTHASAADRVRPLRLGWAMALALVLLLAGLWAVPPVRAAIQAWLQLGAVRIWLVEPTPTPLPPTVTPRPTPTPLAAIIDLAGETTLAEATAQVPFTVRLPSYPADLGEPDRVYLQDLGGPALILVWLEPGNPEQVRMSLHLLGSGAFVWKMQPPLVQETTVHGQTAYWTEGPYHVKLHTGGQWGNYRLIDGHVLIWTEGEMTYRLETALPLTEAVRIAESLR